MPRLRRFGTLAGRLRRDSSGLALIEFAFTMPLLLGLGLYGVETANLALMNLRISQIALNLADNASRVGDSSLATQQLREVDINDVLQAVRYQGKSINLTTQGRIIVSSLENIQRTYADGTSDSAPVQRIHWQRCMGMKTGAGYDYSYGTTSATAGTDLQQSNAGTATPNGMGDTGAMVTAPSGSGVMFVEINYNYKPLISNYLLSSSTRLHYIASFIVRDPRDFSRLFNPSPTATKATCNLYAV